MDEQSKRFYAVLAESYDEVFPAEKQTVDYLLAHGARAGSAVLDVACGTGAYTDALVEAGVDARGIDGSADLVRIGRSRSRWPDRLGVRDMRSLSGHDRRENMVFCIGNSLPHLSTTEEVRQVIASFAGVLRGGAADLVLQYVDTESIELGGVRELPTLETERVRFERRYVRKSESTVVFAARLTDVQSRTASEIENTLLVLRSGELVTWLERAGFTDVSVTGGFREQPTEGSWVRVVHAQTAEAGAASRSP